MSKKGKKISIAISPEMEKKLDKGKYNRSKLIICLLEEYLLKTTKKD